MVQGAGPDADLQVPLRQRDVSPEAHRQCQFGQWYYTYASARLQQLPAFVAIEAEHARMHQLAAHLLMGAKGLLSRGWNHLQVTASFGVAELDPNLPVEATLDRTDEALYAAKGAGRNCARAWGSRDVNEPCRTCPMTVTVLRLLVLPVIHGIVPQWQESRRS
jgi:Chemoreceptor zinc-binding domain